MGTGHEEQDFEQYVVARQAGLGRIAYGLVGERQAAEDLVQTTLVKLYTRWRRLRADNLDGYVRRMLVNAYLDGRRRQRDLVVESVPDRPARDAGHEDWLDLGRALARLTPRRRAVLVLRFVEDLSVADTAATLGISEGAVKSHTHQALALLRQDPTFQTVTLTQENDR
jgi:RNA polymerase sigma-70 factor (sigma-E family)